MRTCLLFPHQRDLLVFGYIRQTISVFAPIELQQLCYDFYNDIIDWQLNDNTLQQFSNTQYDEKYIGPQFKLIDIPFQLISWPNGCKNCSNEGFISLYLQLLNDKLPKDIVDFTIYAHLFCSVTKVQWKKAITLKYLQRTSGKRSGWFRYNMKLKDYNKCKSIIFCCYLELINIVRKDENMKLLPLNIVSISMNSKCTYEWNIDKDTLNEFKISNSGQCYYSPNFNNNCFCIIVIPKGRVTDVYGSFRTLIKLLKLPKNVSGVFVKCMLNVISSNKENERDYTLHEKLKLGYISRQNVASSTLFYTPNTDIFESALSIKVSMEITQVFDRDEADLSRENWSKFNVMINDE
eukprot:423646_1